jgi:hypothetical protein
MREMIFLVGTLLMALSAQAEIYMKVANTEILIRGDESWCSGRTPEKNVFLIDCIHLSKRACEQMSKDECKSKKELGPFIGDAIKAHLEP